MTLLTERDPFKPAQYRAWPMTKVTKADLQVFSQSSAIAELHDVRPGLLQGYRKGSVLPSMFPRRMTAAQRGFRLVAKAPLTG